MKTTEHPITREQAAKRFAKRFRAVLKQRKMTMKSIGERLGLTRATLSAWSQGHNIPPAWRLYEVARLLDVPVEYFLMEDEEKAEAIIDAARFLELYHSMDEKQREALIGFLATLTPCSSS